MMRLWKNRWTKIAVVAVLAVACTGAATEARHLFRFWWLRPPAPAIENTAFTGEVTGGRLRSIAVTDGAITSNVLLKLNEGTFDATVIDETLSFEEIVLTGSSMKETTVDTTTTTTTTTATVTIDLAETDLHPTFFHTVFRARGTAEVSIVVEEVVDDGSGTPTSSETTTETTIPVYIFGSIHRHGDGPYHLRGFIRGFDYTFDNATGDVAYTLLGARLNGEGTPIPEELPDD